MVTIDLRIDRKRYKRKIPGSYEELSRRQAVRMADTWMRLQIPFAPPANWNPEKGHWIKDTHRFALLQSLLDLPDDDFYKLGDLAIVSLLESSPFNSENILTGEPVLKFVNRRFHRYSLPEKALASSPFIQFIFAEESYQNIQEEKPLNENLDGLVSILCLSRFKKILLDISFAWRYLEWGLIPGIDNIPISQKYAVLQYYYGSRRALRSLFSPMFTSSGGNKRTGPDLTSKYRWWALAHDLAEKGVFGNLQETFYTPLHLVLHHVCYNADKYKQHEIESKLKRKKHG